MKKTHINKSGYLDVGDGHQIYWEDWGNPKANPIVHLHGGPGGGFSDSHKLLYDPKVHRVIFHDQRGCSRSTPFASTKNNTTKHLIADIERLRNHLGIMKVYVSGGSWGSALALLYAIAHPSKVSKIMLWSVYLVRQAENDFVNLGYARYNLPHEWDRFISLVPVKYRKNGNDVMRYYQAKILSKDKKISRKYAIEWTLWESSLVSLDHNPKELEKDIAQDPRTPAIAILETHYFLNGCFVPENYVLDNLKKITHIPAFVVHGRFDFCTPALSAAELAVAYGKKLSLRWVNASHLRTEPEMLTALREIAKKELT